MQLIGYYAIAVEVMLHSEYFASKCMYIYFIFDVLEAEIGPKRQSFFECHWFACDVGSAQKLQDPLSNREFSPFISS